MMKHFAIITVAALGGLLATVGTALAGDTNWTTNILGPLTIDGNVVVPDGASCSLGYLPPSATPCCISSSSAVQVTGNVTVGHGSGLTVGVNSTIAGNLQANNCNFVELVDQGSETVGSNVQIGNCTGQPAFVSTGTGSLIGGDFQCDNNTGPCILDGDYVGGNVQVMNNVSPAGSPSIISYDHIAKNLQCQNNSPTPIGGANYMVAGNNHQSSEGQCLDF
jgi:hypothetical protein